VDIYSHVTWCLGVGASLLDPLLQVTVQRVFQCDFHGGLFLLLGCGVGVGRNFKWSRSRKEFLGGVRVGVGKNVPTPTPTSV
jgi:hypothetical protein